MAINFKKSALTVAVASAIAVPMAANAAFTTVNFGPAKAGAPFAGKAGTKVGFYTDGAATGPFTAAITFFDDGGAPIPGSTSAIVVLTGQTSGNLTLPLVDGAASAVVQVTAIDAADAGAAAGDFLQLDGTWAAGAALIPVDDSYAGIQIVEGLKNSSTAPTEVYVRFNADPINSATDQPFANNTNVLDSNGGGEKIFSPQGSGDNEVAAAQVVAPAARSDWIFIDEGSGAGVPFSENVIQVVGGAGSLAPAATDLSDGAGNTYRNATVAVVKQPDLAINDTVSAPGIAESFGPDGLYNNEVGESGSGLNVFGTVHFNQDLGTAFNANADMVVVDEDGINIEARLNDTAWGVDGNTTTFTLDPLGNNRVIYMDGALYVVDAGPDLVFQQAELDAANKVGVKFVAGGVDTLIGANALAADTTQPMLNAGSEKTRLFRTHGSAAGQFDGVTVDFQQGVTVSNQGYELRVTGSGMPAGETDLTLGAITVQAVAANSDSTAANVTFDTATRFDWDNSGVLDTADDDLYATFGTGAQALNRADVYLSGDTSQTKYDAVWDADTGELKNASFGFSTAGVDGINPTLLTAVLEDIEGSDLKNLALGFSEDVAEGVATNTPNVVALNGVPLNLGNINAGVPTLGGGQVAVSPTDSTILNVAGVAGAEVGQTVSIATSPEPTDGDTAGNPITAPTGADAVSTTAGDTVFLRPDMVNAFAIQSAVTGETTTVVVQYDKAVAKGPDATSLDGVFLLDVDPEVGANVQLSVPEADITGLGTDRLELNLPIGVVNGNIDGIAVEYNANGDNKLVSTDAEPVDACDTGTVGCDEQPVDYSANTKGLYSMELEGSAVVGAEDVPDGTLMRVDLIAAGVDAVDGTATVPCAECGKPKIAITGGLAGISDAIGKARVLGEKSVEATLFFENDGDNNWFATFNNSGPFGFGTSYAVKVDAKSGKITGDANGQLTLEDGGQMVWDTTYALFDGSSNNWRLNIGSDVRPTDGFVTAAVQVPGTPGWQQVIPADPALAGAVPFVDHLDTNGTIVDAGPIDVTAFEAVPVMRYANWQTFGPQETINFAGKNKDLDPERFFFFYDENGNPSNCWLDGDQDDMAFLLTNNKVDAAYEFNGMTAGEIKGLDGTRGVAFMEGDTPADAGCRVLGGGINAAVPDADNNYHLWIPTTEDAPERDIAKGWDLFTVTGETPLPVADLGFDAVICSGNGDQALSFFLGADANSLAEVDPGDTCFGHTEKGIKGFDGR